MSAFLPLKDTLQTNTNTFQDVFEYRNCKFVKQMCAVCAKWQEFFILPWNTFYYPFITISSSTTSFLGNLKFVLKATK